MAETYYAQGEHRAKTMTVGELIAALTKHDPAALVIFRSPLYGVFGSNTAYSIDAVTAETLERQEHHYKGGEIACDEETGEEYVTEPYTEVFHSWSGVVIE